MSNRLNILFPGAFKPVHAGHMAYMDMYLNNKKDEDVQLYVLLSSKDRDGITAESSLKFLNKIFGRFHNFHVIVTNGSPIRAAYDLTATKAFGDGMYALAASTKDTDVQRALDFNKAFSKDGKYYTPGVKPMLLITDEVPMYVNRDDEFNESPISARIVRSDIMRDDYNAFLSAYETPYLPKYVKEEDLIEYYNELQNLIRTPMNEGGAAGHINHPYDDNDLTFAEIRDMIDAIFNGKIEDITEKIDGINIMASVDENGKTIFARNKTQLLNTPMHIDDIINNNTWNMKTRDSFINGAECIEKVFDNLKDKVAFFNYDDHADSVKYRNWISVEIVDHSNMNVIPYVDNFVSFHDHMITVCWDYNIDSLQNIEIFENPNQERQLIELEDAVSKTNETDKQYKAQMTPKMMFIDNANSKAMFDNAMTELIDLMEEYGITWEDTVGTYKNKATLKFIIHNQPIQYITREEMQMLADRWSGTRNVKLSEFKRRQDTKNIVVSSIKKYEKERLSKLKKRIMQPLDWLFINVGNDALKLFKGGKNEGNEEKVIKSIKKNITDAISSVQETGSEKDLDKLEYLLFRLGDTVDVNATEGIVFRYHDRTYKLTGSFAVLNQVVNLGRNIEIQK